MSDAGQLDQVAPEVLDDMRLYVNACSNEDGDAMTDEEVLSTIDEHYYGGSAQFNREQTSGDFSSDVGRAS